MGTQVSTFGGALIDAVLADRAPLATDNTYKPGQTWVDTVAKKWYVCAGIAAGVATWTSGGGGGGGSGTYYTCTDPGNPIAATMVATTDFVHKTSHGLPAGTQVEFTGAGLPPEITPLADYYVINPTIDDYQISATPGGLKINFSINGNGNYATINFATNTAVIDANDGVVITTSGPGVPQILETPTTADKVFGVVNVAASLGNITIFNGLNPTVLEPGQGQRYYWDGAAWDLLSSIDADEVTFVPYGGVTDENVQDALETVIDKFTSSTVADMFIYIDGDAGSDSTGTGVIAFPYKTVAHAIATLPTNIDHMIILYLKPRAGGATYNFMTPYNFLFDGKVIKNSISIYAYPGMEWSTAFDSGTMTANTYFSHTDATKVWVANEHRGRFLHDLTTHEYFAITGNTTSTIRCTGSSVSYAIVPTTLYEIVEPSVNIWSNGYFLYNFSESVGHNCTFSFKNLKFTNGSFATIAVCFHYCSFYLPLGSIMSLTPVSSQYASGCALLFSCVVNSNVTRNTMGILNNVGIVSDVGVCAAVGENLCMEPMTAGQKAVGAIDTFVPDCESYYFFDCFIKDFKYFITPGILGLSEFIDTPITIADHFEFDNVKFWVKLCSCLKIVIDPAYGMYDSGVGSLTVGAITWDGITAVTKYIDIDNDINVACLDPATLKTTYADNLDVYALKASTIKKTPLATRGAPTAGTWAVGDEICDSLGAIWECTAAGTPGTWAQIMVNSSTTGTLAMYIDGDAGSDTTGTGTIGSPVATIPGAIALLPNFTKHSVTFYFKPRAASAAYVLSDTLTNLFAGKVLMGYVVFKAYTGQEWTAALESGTMTTNSYFKHKDNTKTWTLNQFRGCFLHDTSIPAGEYFPIARSSIDGELVCAGSETAFDVVHIGTYEIIKPSIIFSCSSGGFLNYREGEASICPIFNFWNLQITNCWAYTNLSLFTNCNINTNQTWQVYRTPDACLSGFWRCAITMGDASSILDKTQMCAIATDYTVQGTHCSNTAIVGSVHHATPLAMPAFSVWNGLVTHAEVFDMYVEDFREYLGTGLANGTVDKMISVPIYLFDHFEFSNVDFFARLTYGMKILDNVEFPIYDMSVAIASLNKGAITWDGTTAATKYIDLNNDVNVAVLDTATLKTAYVDDIIIGSPVRTVVAVIITDKDNMIIYTALTATPLTQNMPASAGSSFFNKTITIINDSIYTITLVPDGTDTMEETLLLAGKIFSFMLTVHGAANYWKLVG